MKPDKKDIQYSKRVLSDIRALLWVITIGGLALAVYVIWSGYSYGIEWISLMVSSAWACESVIVSFYMSKSKAEHLTNGTDYLRLQADIEHEKNIMMGTYDNIESNAETTDCGMPQI